MKYFNKRIPKNDDVELNKEKMITIDPEFGMTINEKPEDYGWFGDIKLTESIEFSFDPMEVDFTELKEALEAPADAPVFIKYKYDALTQNKLHKKKRIAKKWAKQGKYKKIRKTVYAEVGKIEADICEDIAHYTVELKHE